VSTVHDAERASLEQDPKRPALVSGVSLAILVLSLSVRLLAWSSLAGYDGVPQFDEQGYLHRAQGFAEVFRDAAALRPPSATALDEAYGGGTWPPLNSILIAWALILGKGAVGAARALEVLASASATLLLFALTERIGDRRAASTAALCYALLPSIVHYAPLLLSESLYLLILSALALQLAALVQGDGSHRRARVVRLGVLCGLAMLTRAVAIAAWLVTLVVVFRTGRGRPRRGIELLLAAGVSILVVLPWQTALHLREGGMPILSTATGLNLLVANNPWQKEAGDRSLPFLDHHLREEAKKAGESPGAAARRLALGEIALRPTKTLSNAMLQLRRLLAPDRVTLRSFETAYYRPIAPGALPILVVILLLTAPLILGGAAAGVLMTSGRRGMSVLVALALAHALPSLVAVSNPRFFLPSLFLLLPPFGAFAERALRAGGLRWHWATAWGIALLVALATWTLGPRAVPDWESSSFYPRPSTATLALVRTADRTFDCVELQRAAATQSALEVDLTTPGYVFADGSSRVVWQAGDPSPTLRVEIHGRARGLPSPALSIAARGGEEPILFSPVQAGSWWRWMPLGDSPYRARWCGGEKLRKVARGLEPYRPTPPS